MIHSDNPYKALVITTICNLTLVSSAKLYGKQLHVLYTHINVALVKEKTVVMRYYKVVKKDKTWQI